MVSYYDLLKQKQICSNNALVYFYIKNYQLSKFFLNYTSLFGIIIHNLRYFDLV